MQGIDPYRPTSWRHIQTDDLPSSQPYTITERENLALYLGSKDIEPILSNPRLFWLLFCTEFYALQKSNNFYWTCDSEQFACLDRTSLNELLHSSIERVRTNLLERYKLKQPAIFCPAAHIVPPGIEIIFLLPLSQDLIADFSGIDSNKDIPDYFSIFLPCFTTMIATLGGKLSRQVLDIQINNCWWLNASVIQSREETLVVDFSTIRELPPAIAERTVDEQQKQAYGLYQQQLFCDTTLKLEDGDLQIHALTLFSNGGKQMKQTLFNQGNAPKVIWLNGFNLTTANAFVDFIYLGPDAVARHQACIYELLRLAWNYQIEPLIDSCTHLISRIAARYDTELIGQLAKHYDNAHLRMIYQHLIGLRQ